MEHAHITKYIHEIVARVRATFMNRNREVSCLLIVGIIALTLRMMNLEFYPRWYADEGTNIALGLNMLHGHMGYLTWGPNFFPPFYDFLIGSLLNFWGNNFLIARIPSAVMGTLSCVFLYLIGKRLYNQFIGLFSALLLSVAGMFINRMALSYTAIEFFLLLSAVSYFKLFDTEEKKWSLLMGASAGLAFLSSYMGVIVFAFLFLQAFVDRKLGKIKFAILTFLLLSLAYPLLGLAFGWKWFIYDLFYQASRVFDPQQLVYVLSLTPPYFRWDWFPPYHWTLLGFVSCFCLITRRDFGNHEWNDKFLFLMLFSILAVLSLSGSLWWVHVILIYPIYCLGISLLVFDVYRGEASSIVLLLISIILLPPLLINATLRFSYLSDYFSLFYCLILVLVLSAFLAKSGVLNLNFVRKFKLFNQENVAAKCLFIVVIMIFSGLVFFADVSLLGTNAASDQVEVVNFINSHTNQIDLVAANPAIACQLHSVGIDYAQVAFYTTKKPIFLYEDTETMLSRFNMNVSLANIKYIVIDSHWPGASSDIKGYWYGEETTSAIRSSWWNVFNVGDYSVYLNPERLSLEELILDFGWKDSLSSEGWSLAYQKGTSEQRLDSDGKTMSLMAASSALPKPDDHVFWERNVGDVSLADYPSFTMKYKISEPHCRIVVKFLSSEGKEVGGWFIDPKPSTDYKIAVYTPTASNVSYVVVGMDGFGIPHKTYTLCIENIGFFKIAEE